MSMMMINYHHHHRHIMYYDYCLSSISQVQLIVIFAFDVNLTNVMHVVSECLDMSNILSISNYIVKKHELLVRFINSQNSLCSLFLVTTENDLDQMTLL